MLEAATYSHAVVDDAAVDGAAVDDAAVDDAAAVVDDADDAAAVDDADDEDVAAVVVAGPCLPLLEVTCYLETWAYHQGTSIASIALMAWLAWLALVLLVGTKDDQGVDEAGQSGIGHQGNA